jgi:beta-phosphoglucomutase-like phosphatase (HAD superfamily)
MCNSLIDNYDLFIFDLDDTLIKTENYHYIAWLTVLKEVKNENFYIDFNTFCSKFHSNKENNIKTYLLDELNITNYDKIIEKKTDCI